MSLKAALGQIGRVRPQVAPNAGFLAQLKELERELFGSVSLEVEELPKREKDRLALFDSKYGADAGLVEEETIN
jgi:atypical dual specificity phosphatase